MKKQPIIIGGVLVVFALACIFGGQALAEQMKKNQKPEPISTTSTAPSVEPVQSEEPVVVLPSFIMPTPAPNRDPDAPGDAPKETVTSTTPGTGVTITKDEDGNQDIVPNWSTDGLPAGAVVVPAKPEPNIGGSGGGKLDMGSDGAYHGDHPNETPTQAPTPANPTATPTPTPTGTEPSTPDSGPGDQPQTPPEQTTPPKEPSATDKPAEDPSTPSKPSGGDSNPKNGQISEDGTKMWFEGFGWVDKPKPSVSTPGKGTHTELGGETVGSM